MRQSRALGFASVILLLSIGAIGQTDELEKSTADSEKAKDDELSTLRFELMQKRVAGAKITSNEKGFPARFVSKPIFRYSDPARGYVSAALWKLGDEGRPRALLTTELHRSFGGRPRIVYEYLSLTPTRFSAIADGMRWEPDGSALDFKPIPDAAAPEETAQRRLLQMRTMAKRFEGEEHHGAVADVLRLLPQPADRYTPSSAEHADGAIFLLSFGTNPEIALFIESDGTAWNFAAGRLSGAGIITLSIDGKRAWEGAPVKYGYKEPYTASNAVADIPGVAPDGSEIKK